MPFVFLLKNRLNDELINEVRIRLFAARDVSLVSSVVSAPFKAHSSLAGSGPLCSAKTFLLLVPVAVFSPCV